MKTENYNQSALSDEATSIINYIYEKNITDIIKYKIREQFSSMENFEQVWAELIGKNFIDFDMTMRDDMCFFSYFLSNPFLKQK